ncbi:MAG: HAMP domain-containing sensor histidine kinase [Prevotellaceae bacterium]|nr:HAMP domain-containing sensor histidine kinase [Prevotellaceae bacterium]
MIIIIVLTIVLVFSFALYLFHRHQRILRTSAFLMREAVRNGDFTFRVPTKGMFFGEKALIEALNDMENNIGQLTAQNEVESWEKLTRVLTHEINNATTPILTICQAYLSSPSMQGSPYREGIEAIHDTTSALAAFVDSYRKMTQIQRPAPEDVSLRDFFSGIACMYPSLQWHIDIPQQLSISIDPNLLRQAVINLVKNAVEAGAANMAVRWLGRKLYISNDGAPIPPERHRDLFVPFYTTKRHGSGIGLPLSRQILMMQGYDLSLAPVPQMGHHVTFVVSHC